MKDPKPSQDTQSLFGHNDVEGDKEAMYNLVHFFETLIEMDRQHKVWQRNKQYNE